MQIDTPKHICILYTCTRTHIPAQMHVNREMTFHGGNTSKQWRKIWHLYFHNDIHLTETDAIARHSSVFQAGVCLVCVFGCKGGVLPPKLVASSVVQQGGSAGGSWAGQWFCSKMHENHPPARHLSPILQIPSCEAKQNVILSLRAW